MDHTYIDNVLLTDADTYGRILTSTKPFQPGDVIFAESPLLVWSSSSSSSSCLYSTENALEGGDEGQQKDNNGNDDIDESIRMDYNYIKAFTLLPKDLQDEVLDLHCPDFKNDDIDSYLSEYSSKYYYRKMVVDMFVSMKYFESLDDDIIMKLLLINDSNAHTYHGCDSNDYSHKAALFKMGSKMEHSCKPNVTYSSKNKENKLMFTASHFIEAGSRLSFSYIESYKLSRKQRIELLRSSFYFVCKCVRCCGVEYDDSRAIRCSSCDGVSYFIEKGNSNSHEGEVIDSRSCADVPVFIDEPGDEGDNSTLICLTCKVASSEKRKGELREKEKSLEKKYNSFIKIWKECQTTDIFLVKPLDLENLFINATKSLHFTHYLVGNILSLCASVYTTHYRQLSQSIFESTPACAISSVIGYKFLGVDILREKSLQHTMLQLKAIECLISGCTVPHHTGIYDDSLLFPHMPCSEAAHLALFCFQDAEYLDLKNGKEKEVTSLSRFLAARYYSCVRSQYGEEDDDVVAMLAKLS